MELHIKEEDKGDNLQVTSKFYSSARDSEHLFEDFIPSASESIPIENLQII
jgi:hypothetical protein